MKPVTAAPREKWVTSNGAPGMPGNKRLTLLFNKLKGFSTRDCPRLRVVGGPREDAPAPHLALRGHRRGVRHHRHDVGERDVGDAQAAGLSQRENMKDYTIHILCCFIETKVRYDIFY